jgi:hypothetical protein
MSDSSLSVSKKNLVAEKLEEEYVILTLTAVIEEPNQEHLMEPSVSSSADIKHAEHFPCPKPNCNKPILPLSTILPPVNEVSGNTLWN